MTTALYEVELNDGRIFRIFCANSTQNRKAQMDFNEKRDLFKRVDIISNGIHTYSQYKYFHKTF